MIRVAVTTTSDRADRIATLVADAGMRPVTLPCITTVSASPELLAEIRRAALTADWIVCTSARAVEHVWPEGNMPTRPRVAAVGPVTAGAVAAAGGRVAVVGSGGGAALAGLMRGRLRDQVAVVPHARMADPATVAMLQNEAAAVVAAPVYDTHPVPPPLDPVDAIILGSPSALHGWLSSRSLAGLIVAVPGETTATAVRSAGFEPAVISEAPGAAAVVTALAAYVEQSTERSPL